MSGLVRGYSKLGKLLAFLSEVSPHMRRFYFLTTPFLTAKTQPIRRAYRLLLASIEDLGVNY